MENGLVDLKNGSILYNNIKLSLNMNIKDIKPLINDYIKSESQFYDKDGYYKNIICLFSNKLFNIPSEIRLFFHDNILYKIYISFDANNIKVENETKYSYEEKLQKMIEKIKDDINKQYTLTTNGTNYKIFDNGYVLSATLDKFLKEYYMTIEKE